ncbi:MAG: NADAR family protein [Polyangiaceae bacterium]|nr:NADAR family protein [Polyangiaceae bacterium]
MNSDLPTNLAELQGAHRRGAKLHYLFFWGHTPKAGNSPVGKECLSQWYPAPFKAEGHTFPTAEHYMMYQKSVLFGDSETAAKILGAPSPAAAKDLGRSARGFDQAVWESQRLPIVAAGNEAKFSQHPELLSFLLSTNNKVLVEASPRDRVWGIGMSETHEHAQNPLEWRGLNLLGFALMIARQRLAK